MKVLTSNSLSLRASKTERVDSLPLTFTDTMSDGNSTEPFDRSVNHLRAALTFSCSISLENTLLV